MMIANMFSPYGVLMHTSYAATIAAGEPYYELSIREIVNSDNEDEWTDETYYYYYDYPL